MSLDKKWIREGRMGAPMSYKTGAVVETYPKPMLVLEFDSGGLDVVKQPITRMKPDELRALCATNPKTESLPPIIAVEFANLTQRDFSLDVKTYDNTTALYFQDCVNAVVKACKIVDKAKKDVEPFCPWKTIVVDPVTGLNSAFVGHIGITDSGAMADARNWAHKVGVLVERAIMVVQGLPCHTVFIFHYETEKNEITGEIITEPMVPSKFRQRVAGMFSQFFYAVMERGEPVVYAQPTGFVKGLGMKKPEKSPDKMGARFQDIYGKTYD